MRIALIALSGIYPVHTGGPPNVAFFLGQALADRGHSVHLFVRVRDKKELLRFLDLIEPYQATNLEFRPMVVDYSPSFLVNTPLVITKMISIADQIAKGNYDSIIYNSPPVDLGFLLPWVARMRNLVQVLIVHGGLFYELSNVLGRRLLVFERCLFDLVVPVSRFAADLIEQSGFSRNRIRVIHNGVDSSVFEKTYDCELTGNPVLLFVGRLAAVKGLDILLRALPSVLETMPEARLYVAGDGPERERLKIMRDCLGVSDNVVFLGSIPPEDKRLYKSASLLVFPSRMENFPLVVLEGMAAGLPIVCSDIPGGPQELTKMGARFWLFEPENEVHLAQTIVAAFSKLEEAKLVAEGNQVLARKEFTWEAIAGEYCRAIQDIVDGGRRNRG